MSDISPEDYMIARRMADRLMTTCNPPELWDELEEMTHPQHIALDAIAFECQTCNHWFSVAERHEGDNGQFYCKDCL